MQMDQLASATGNTQLPISDVFYIISCIYADVAVSVASFGNRQLGLFVAETCKKLTVAIATLKEIRAKQWDI